ncbi:Yqey-like protein-domain-containing protein [Mycena floridula]|nr:Yqey-like protein-domain-containing protein [Mycena floridula]
MFCSRPWQFSQRCAYSQTKSVTIQPGTEIRDSLNQGVKAAMKARDTFTSTVLRSVISEIQAEDKLNAPETLSSSSVVGIIRKAVAKRNDAAAQFQNASRPELAEKELREVQLLSAYLPALLPDADVDKVLAQCIEEMEGSQITSKSIGAILKSFYQKVDKATVEPRTVKSRLDLLLK